VVCSRTPGPLSFSDGPDQRALAEKAKVHRAGDGAAWWEKAGIDPIITARTLWLETRPPLWPKKDAQIGSLQE
jgi:hypothetical protein